MFRDLDTGNFDGMLAKMDTDATAFDFDTKNQPISMRNLDEIRALFAALGKSMKEGGLSVKTDVGHTDCRATGAMGYCGVEFDQTMTQGGQAMGPFKFRGTLVARKVGDTWKWAHWHGSFREMPPMEMMHMPAAPGEAPATDGAPPAETPPP
jgi:hypothetical protein